MKVLSAIDIAKLEHHLTEIGDMIYKKGCSEAQTRTEARPIDDFAKLAAKVFGLNQDTDHETAQAVGSLWRDYYMNGYNAMRGGAVHDKR